MEIMYTQQNIDQIAQTIISDLPKKDGATIIALRGDLGAGKTTLTQAIAKYLGVVEVFTSPTFVIAKFYDTKNDAYKNLVHIDAYRIEEPHELVILGWEEIVLNQENIVVIEWPEKIAAKIPARSINLYFDFVDEVTRKIRKG